MRFWKRNNVFGKRTLRSRFALAYWPDDIAGWLRIPSMIAGIMGIVGVVGYFRLPVAGYLKSFNLPSAEICWLMLGIGCTVYLLSLACWLFVEDVAVTCRPDSGDCLNQSSRWRSM